MMQEVVEVDQKLFQYDTITFVGMGIVEAGVVFKGNWKRAFHSSKGLPLYPYLWWSSSAVLASMPIWVICLRSDLLPQSVVHSSTPFSYSSSPCNWFALWPSMVPLPLQV